MRPTSVLGTRHTAMNIQQRSTQSHERQDLQPRLLYPAKLSFRMEGQIKCFPDKVKLKDNVKFIITQSLLYEMITWHDDSGEGNVAPGKGGPLSRETSGASASCTPTRPASWPELASRGSNWNYSRGSPLFAASVRTPLTDGKQGDPHSDGD